MEALLRRPPKLPCRGPSAGTVQPPAKTREIHTASDAVVVGAEARCMALSLALSRPSARCVEIAVRELATNVARHAGGGVILLYGVPRWMAVLAGDEGPGIADVVAARRDRFSGGRHLDADASWDDGLGCGLGAVHRLMDHVEICTAPGRGTWVLACKDASPTS